MSALTNWERLAKPEWESDPDAQLITAEKPDPSFYAMIPKLAQWILTPYELALYVNYKQTVGESPNGKCFKSAATLAKETRMSSRQVQRARTGLERKGLIKVISKGKDQPPDIFILDAWQTNREFFHRDAQPTFDELQSLVGLDSQSNQGKTDSLTPQTESPTKKNHRRRTNKEISVAPNGSTPRASQSKSKTVRSVPKSKADQHPELSLEELEAAKRKAIEESTAQGNREAARQKNFAALEKAVKVLPGVSGKLATQYAHMLNGTATKGVYSEYRIDGGVTAVEFETFIKWYPTAHPNQGLPKVVETLHGYVSEWIDAGKPAAPSSNGANPLAGFKEYTGKDSS